MWHRRTDFKDRLGVISSSSLHGTNDAYKSKFFPKLLENPSVPPEDKISIRRLVLRKNWNSALGRDSLSLLLKLQDMKIGNRFRDHSDDDVSRLVESIKDVGLLHPTVITVENRLVCGKGRIEAYTKLCMSEISVISPDIDMVQRDDTIGSLLEKFCELIM